MNRSYIRIAGKLWEDGKFERGVGWETERIVRRPRASTAHRLQLLNDSGHLLVEGSVELKQSGCRVEGAYGMAGARLHGYLPLREDGRSIVLRLGDHVMHREEISVSRPTLRVTTLDHSHPGILRVKWDAEHDRQLWFQVMFVDGQRRRLVVARELHATHTDLDLSTLSGGDGCVVAILATDGIRSTLVRSKPIDLPSPVPQVIIIQPATDEALLPDQPFSLIGAAFERLGKNLPEEHLVWAIDGVTCARSRRVAAGEGLAPGDHQVALSYAPPAGPPAQAEVTVTVRKRSREHEEWLRVSRQLVRNAT